MSLENIFYWSYWFSQPSELVGGLEVVGFIIPVGLLISALLLRMVAYFRYKEDQLLKRIWWRISNSIFCFGFINLIWFVFRQQRIPYLAYRFWMLILIIIIIWWIYTIIKYALKRVPEIREERIKREQKEKYFPKNYSVNH